eukprot:5426298-Ditylum_brightwellii.AAC.1
MEQNCSLSSYISGPTESWGPLRESTTNVLTNIGIFLGSECPTNTMDHLKQSPEIRKLQGNEHEKVADVLIEIATLLNMQEESDEAIECFWEVLQILKLWLGPQHICIADTLAQIRTINTEREDHELTLQSFEEALNIYRTNLCDDAVDVSHTLYNKENLHDAMGEYDESLSCFTEALHIFKGWQEI